MSLPSRERSRLLHGSDEAPAPPTLLRAGPITALLDGVDLRDLRYHGVEVARRIHVAVRDANWNTLPAKVSDLRVEVGEDRFAVTFAARHEQDGADFLWRGELRGAPDGRISATMDGEALSAFRYNRIGFCVLHPMTAAGRPYTAEAPDGSFTGTLPGRIGPQRVVEGVIQPLFPAFHRLTLDMKEGLTAAFAFEGEQFEMEDQRNWTDASFKTYCTPLSEPWPRDARPGQRFRQSVTLAVPEGTAAEQSNALSPPREALTVSEGPEGSPRRVEIQLGAVSPRAMPPVGLGRASHGAPLAPREAAFLRAMRPAHLRADLRLGEPGWEAALTEALAEAKRIGCPLELALFLSDAGEAELAALASRPIPAASVARVLVFHSRVPVTSVRWLLLARERLATALSGVPVIGGTHLYFCDLNRDRPTPDALAACDGIAYSINPQVHAFDERSLVETLEAQPETVRSARALCGDRTLHLSPVTLKPRFNAVATAAAAHDPRALPDAVDPRQASLFGAAWTLGSLKALAESGAASLTYYETTGWRGVMETKAGSPLPALFPSQPGGVFPLAHVLADVMEAPGAALLSCESSDPATAVGMAWRDDRGPRLLLANLTPEERNVVIRGWPGDSARLRRMNEATAEAALRDPEAFRARPETLAVPPEGVTLRLLPYETLRLDSL